MASTTEKQEIARITAERDAREEELKAQIAFLETQLQERRRLQQPLSADNEQNESMLGSNSSHKVLSQGVEESKSHDEEDVSLMSFGLRLKRQELPR